MQSPLLVPLARHPKNGVNHTEGAGLSHTAFEATRALFANTFPIGNDVAPHDSTTKTHREFFVKLKKIINHCQP